MKENKFKNLSIMIAIPTMGDVSIIFTTALIEMILETKNKFDCEIRIETVVRQMHHRARNELADRFLASDCDYILWLDDDNIPGKNDLINLIEKDLPLVSGLYFKRVKPYSPIIMVYKDDKVGTELREDFYRERKGLVEIHSTGMGFMLIKKQVMEDTKALGITLFDVRGQIGEDIWFCAQVKAAGYKIWLDTDLVIGHLGERELVNGNTYEDYYSKNILEVVDKAMKIDGWSSFEELVYLAELSSCSKFTIEIGSYKGRSSVALSNSKKLVCIDKWKGEFDEDFSSDVIESFIKNIEGRKVEYLKGNSSDKKIIDRFEDGCADLIFIDGGHDYNQVKSDLNNYIEKLRAGGKICLHDYIYEKFGVREAVDEFMKENKACCVGRQIKDTSIFEIMKF